MTNGKHPGGRPLKFGTAEEIESKANEYFNSTPQNLWTITGLALALDTSRKVLQEYQDERPEFSNTIKRIKAKIEHAYELRGMEKGTAFDIFRLKNMGWRDKTETDITSGGDKIKGALVEFVDANQTEDKDTDSD